MTDQSLRELIDDRRLTWAVTGVAGFIGSHLAETLVGLGQRVVGIDDLSTGSITNVNVVQAHAELSPGDFQFIEGSIEDRTLCAQLTRNADVVLHQAALGSIPRSIADPFRAHSVNITGTLNMLLAARDSAIKRFVYASSSSVYGDDSSLPKHEKQTGVPLAPYATTKKACEHYARNFADHYGMQSVGLRYFNVFGPRQDPLGPYAAVIPKWISQISKKERVTINGDGETTRDFCYIANVVQANLRAALVDQYDPETSVFNVAYGGRTSLNQLYHQLDALINSESTRAGKPKYGALRPGDVRHSQADVSLAANVLGYSPTHDVNAGLAETVAWFQSQT